MSVTKQDLHAEQKAHAVTRALLDAALTEIERLRSYDRNALAEANRRLTAIGAKPVTGALR